MATHSFGSRQGEHYQTENICERWAAQDPEQWPPRGHSRPAGPGCTAAQRDRERKRVQPDTAEPKHRDSPKLRDRMQAREKRKGNDEMTGRKRREKIMCVRPLLTFTQTSIKSDFRCSLSFSAHKRVV